MVTCSRTGRIELCRSRPKPHSKACYIVDQRHTRNSGSSYRRSAYTSAPVYVSICPNPVRIAHSNAGNPRPAISGCPQFRSGCGRQQQFPPAKIRVPCLRPHVGRNGAGRPSMDRSPTTSGVPGCWPPWQLLPPFGIRGDQMAAGASTSTPLEASAQAGGPVNECFDYPINSPILRAIRTSVTRRWITLPLREVDHREGSSSNRRFSHGKPTRSGLRCTAPQGLRPQTRRFRINLCGWLPGMIVTRVRAAR